MSEFKSPNFRNEDGSAAPDIVGVTTFTSPYYFVPPSGTTAERPSGDGLAPGMLRFNTDIGRLEVWRGDHWATILGESPNLGVNGALGARGLFGSVYNSNVIDYVTISTLGNSLDFGDMSVPADWYGACSSSTRGLFGGGTPGTNTIQYITISSTGNSQDFSDLTVGRFQFTAFSNSTRGIFAGAYNSNVMDYVTIASQGVNAQDFGDLILADNRYAMSCSSSTRGIITSGGSPLTNIINYVTIATTGNAQDFGDLIQPRTEIGVSCSNSTRGVFGGGQAPSTTNGIDFITIATFGNSQDFGDLTVARFQMSGATSSSTRGIFGGGATPITVNTIDYITILTTSNAQDFGDLYVGKSGGDALSNAHGGL